jgi:hypothetical protein
MLPVGFEPMTPVFQRAKTVHALDCADTVIGGSGGIAPPFLTSALDGGEWSASPPPTHCIGGRVVPELGLTV